MNRRAGSALGFSLVELMIVVVIIGILAAIAVVGYKKYIGRARLSEATAMLAEFAAKEQLYFLDNGQYLAAPPGTRGTGYIGNSESAGDFWPSNPSNYFDSTRTPVGVAPLPASWVALGIRPRWQQLYCTYMANAGAGPNAANPSTPDTPLAGTLGSTFWGSPPMVPWFYVLAACNLGGEAGWTNGAAVQPAVTVLALAHDSPAIRTIDETQ